MKTSIEFWGKIENGSIQLPSEYMNAYGGTSAKVIIMLANPNDINSQKQRLKELFAKANQMQIFSEIENPTQWQKTIRDEWE